MANYIFHRISQSIFGHDLFKLQMETSPEPQLSPGKVSIKQGIFAVIILAP
ncbi:hypothetical protein CLV57_3142 [Mucilaginibacter auburnensis]|uniref:Uncharacterized protein n=1 Tax=Mucilaginibacter auburnensis TaxID=1457233 RepID=A0A2H9VNW6_9SPHI|nr:hypothetical protein CLV57_3142 [Mucilaginibacter auburnensis]